MEECAHCPGVFPPGSGPLWDGGPCILGDRGPLRSDSGMWETAPFQLGPALVLGPRSRLLVTSGPSSLRLRDSLCLSRGRESQQDRASSGSGIVGEWCCHSEPPGPGSLTGSGGPPLRDQGPLACLEKPGLGLPQEDTQHAVFKGTFPLRSHLMFTGHVKHRRDSWEQSCPRPWCISPGTSPSGGCGPARASGGNSACDSGASPPASTATTCGAAASGP